MGGMGTSSAMGGMGMYPGVGMGYMGGGERFGGTGFAGGYTDTPEQSPGSYRLDEREM